MKSPYEIMSTELLGIVVRLLLPRMELTEVKNKITTLFGFANDIRPYLLDGKAVDDCWSLIRRDEDIMDVVIHGLAHFNVLLSANNVNFSTVIELLSESFALIIPPDEKLVSLSGVDDTLLSRTATKDDLIELFTANRWLVFLIALTFTPINDIKHVDKVR